MLRNFRDNNKLYLCVPFSQNTSQNILQQNLGYTGISKNFMQSIYLLFYLVAAVASWYNYSTMINIFDHFLSFVFLSFTSLHVSPLLSHFSCQFQLTFSAAFNQTMKKQKFGFKNNTLVLRCLQLTYLEVFTTSLRRAWSNGKEVPR